MRKVGEEIFSPICRTTKTLLRLQKPYALFSGFTKRLTGCRSERASEGSSEYHLCLQLGKY